MAQTVNVIILLFILVGGVVGLKRGFLKEGVSAIGTIIVLVLSFILKNPVSAILYNNLPFFKFGILNEIPMLNVLIYEALAFLIIYVILQAILNLIIKLTGLLDLVLKATIILSIPSRLLGLVFGLIEYYFLTFIIISVLSYFPYTNNYIMESDVAVSIIENTPILPKYSNDAAVAANKIYTLWDNYGSYTDKNDFNLDVLDVSLKYQILKPLEAEKLINSGKLVIKNADSVINKYK